MGNIWIPGEKKHRFTHFPPKSLQRSTILTTPSPNSWPTKTTTELKRITTTYFPPTEEPLPTYVVPSDGGQWTEDSTYVGPNETSYPLPLELGPTCNTEVFYMICNFGR